MEVIVTVTPERNDSFIEGDNVTLTCTGTNPPGVTRPLTFTWGGVFRAGEPFIINNITNDTNDRGITVTTSGNTYTLSIMNIQDDRRIEGTYRCFVFNRIFGDRVIVATEIDVICKMCVCVCVCSV